MPTRTQVEQETVERLRIALGITARHLRSTEAGEGLTPTELSILATISRRGSLRLTELAEIERVNPTMLSRIAGRLAEAQLISREADADDRRAARVKATATGLALHDRIRAQRRASLAAHLDELSDEDARALLAALPALEALAEGLRSDAPGPSSGSRA
jgi:DNA-binding MarR family transcriptional regulator